MSTLSVLIDPGHSPIHPGTNAKDGTPEYDLNLLQAKIVKAELDKAHIPAEIFDPESDLLAQIGQKAADHSMFLSLHHNAFDKKPHYTCVMVHPTKAKPKSISFAKKLSTAIANTIGEKDFGEMKHSVTVLSESEDTNCPICVLCESYFLDAIATRKEAEQLSTKAAYAIASTVIAELQPVSPLRINNPANKATFESKKPVTFTGDADPQIVTVKLQADGQYPLGSDQVDPNGSWSITYSGFTNTGDRKITAIGFDQGNQKKAETSIHLNVVVPPDGLEKIIQIAANSAIASYSWLERGIAPKGYIKGMAVVYAKVYCKLKAGDAFAKEMAKANTGTANKDALAHYAQKFSNLGMNNDTAGVHTLRHLFVLLIGLGMRESSGKYCEGAFNNFTAETAEAGLFQTSYNARSASPLLPQLFEQYLANSSGFVEIFKEGVTCSNKNLENHGEGQGKEFQRLSKDCPAFATEFAAIGLRNVRTHWGPINRLEAEILPEADAMLLEVQKAVDQFELCPILLKNP